MGLFTALLLSVFAAGCDSSGGDSFVATPGGDNGSVAGTGSVTFNFVQAQSPITVPVGTTSLRFEFFSDLAGTGSLLLREVRSYANSVTIEGVPDTARSVVVTAYDSDGFPVSEFVANVTIQTGGNVVVGATDGTSSAVTLTGLTSSPLSLSLGLNGTVALQLSAVFSNEDTVALNETSLDEVDFSSSDTTVATVSDDGVVSAALTGDAVITAVFRGQTIAVPVTVSTGSVIPPVATDLAVDPTSVTLPAGTLSEPITVTATFPGDIERVVTNSQGVVFTSSNPGITVNDDQQILIGNNVAGGLTATVTATYEGQSATIDVNVVTATLQSISVSPASVSLPFGQFEQQLAVTGQFSNGSTVQLNPANLTFSDDSALFTVDSDGLIVTNPGGTPGSGTVTISTNSPLPPFSLDVPVDVGTVFIQSLTTQPVSPVTLTPGEAVEFTVIATLSGGQQVNVTEFDSLVATLNDTDSSAVLNGNRVVAVGFADPDPSVTFSIPGAGQDGDDVSVTVQITINDVQLESVQYLYAGNPLAGNEDTVNLPRGYVGIFEVVGTFSNGSQRKLTYDEYTLQEEGGATDPDGAVELFDADYAPVPVKGQFTDADNYDRITLLSGAHDLRSGTASAAAGSDTSAYVRSGDFRAVVADWRRGEYNFTDDDGAGYIESTPANGDPGTPASKDAGFGNVGDFDRFTVNIDNNLEPTPDEFSRTISVTVTDPDTFQTLTSGSGVFANYPTDPNIPTNVAREFEVRVNFNARTVSDNGISDADPATRLPSVDAQPAFKIAEANLYFERDIEGGNPNLLKHIPTKLGFPALFSANPLQIGALDIFVAPIEGPAARLEDTADDRGIAKDIFGPSFPISWAASELTDDAPDDAKTVIYLPDTTYTLTRVDNNGTGFDIIIPTLFTLDPIGPLSLEVGQGQLFRTLVQYGAGNPVVDRSLDYRPVITLGDSQNPVGGLGGTVTVVGNNDLSSGRITVSAVGTSGSSPDATVQVFDVREELVGPRGSTYTDSLGNTGAPTTTVNINTTPIP
jgi:hypothetical protein